MKWELKTKTETSRTYINDQTGTECITNVIYTDKLGNNWWGFHDLFKIPYIRIAYAKSISDLFQTGLSTTDLREWIAKEKELLRSTDVEKYEKLYSMVLQKEAIINNTTQPLMQHLSLCTVYVLGENERIDYYSDQDAADKLKTWDLDKGACSFFLSWHAMHIQNYTQDLKKLSQIVSNLGN